MADLIGDSMVWRASAISKHACGARYHNGRETVTGCVGRLAQRHIRVSAMADAKIFSNAMARLAVDSRKSNRAWREWHGGDASSCSSPFTTRRCRHASAAWLRNAEASRKRRVAPRAIHDEPAHLFGKTESNALHRRVISDILARVRQARGKLILAIKSSSPSIYDGGIRTWRYRARRHAAENVMHRHRMH